MPLKDFRRRARIKPGLVVIERPLPIFFDPTARRRNLLKVAGIAILLVLLTWSITFGLSLYALAKFSQFDSHNDSWASEIASWWGGSAAPAEDAPVGDEPAAPLSRSGAPVYAYLPYWPDWSTVPLAKALPKIDVLLPEWYRLDLSGARLEPLGFEEPHQRAIADLLRGKPSLQTMPVVNVGDGTNTAQIVSAFASVQTVQRMALSLAETAADRDYDGLCLNLSGIPETSYAGTTRLFALLQEQFRGTGRKTCLIAPVDSPIWGHAPLWPAVDRAVILAFHDATAMAQPGPLAPQGWFADSIAALLARRDPAKIVLAVGSMGSDWTDGAPFPREVSYAEAMRLAGLQETDVGFDRASLNTSFSYVDAEFSAVDGAVAYSGGGHRHTVWLLDAASAYNQLRAVADRKLGGIAVWPLTGVDPAIWKLVAARLPLADPEVALRDVALDDYIGYEGAGSFHQLLRAPQRGVRSVKTDPVSGLIVDVAYTKRPEPYTILRYGAGKRRTVALTFDDGPDPLYTRRILEILKAHDVPATFFVIGKNALRDPAIVAQMAEDGHEIGVHTFFHPVLERVPAWRLRFEVNATERLIASITGHQSLIFRSPYGTGRGPLTGGEEGPMRQIEEYGYVVVGADIAPADWTGTDASTIVASVRAAVKPDMGNVIQLHDGGGNRSATVDALPTIIQALRQEGYTFVPLSTFVGKSAIELMPADASYTAMFDAISFRAIRFAATPFLWIFWAVTLLGVGRAVLIVSLALLRRPHAAPEPDFTPPVTVLIPAFCEEPVIAEAVSAVLASNYPSLSVVVVDDGSTDRTSAVVETAFNADPRVRLITQPNAGKARALNYAYNLIRTDVIVAIDADTIIHPDAIRLLVRHFQDPEVGAVAGNVKVGNRRSLMAKLQSLEYITAQNIDRRAAEMMNGMLVVPGAIGAWRRGAVAKAGFYSSQTLAEDADLTISIVRAGYRVVFEEAAIASTEAPENLHQFMRQRLRWMLGMLQAAWKHGGAIAERRWIGLVSIPELFVFSVVMTALAPIADITFAATLINSAIDLFIAPRAGWSAPSLSIVAAYSTFCLSDILAGVLAFRLEPKEDKRLLLLLPLQRFFYRQLLYVSAIRAISVAFSGRLMKWQKVTRSVGVATSQERIARAAQRQIQLTPK